MIVKGYKVPPNDEGLTTREQMLMANANCVANFIIIVSHFTGTARIPQKFLFRPWVGALMPCVSFNASILSFFAEGGNFRSLL